MNEYITLKNGILEAAIRLPSGTPVSERFDEAGVVEQVVLHGIHRFCQPEQAVEGRWTCNGVGLCSEFEWPEIARDVPPGQLFPKLGVGLLTQNQEAGEYKIFGRYEVQPYETTYTVFDDRVEFAQHPKACMGIAARILKAVQIHANTVTVTTTVENVGEKTLDLFEYQHNFVSIDDLPVGPGYQLELPYDGTISEIVNSAIFLKDMMSGHNIQPVPGIFQAEGQVIRWHQYLDEMMYRKETPEDKLLTLPFYRWTLSHSDSPARISEASHFTPARLVLWGIEHTLSVEVYAKIYVLPGCRQTFARTWYFED